MSLYGRLGSYEEHSCSQVWATTVAELLFLLARRVFAEADISEAFRKSC